MTNHPNRSRRARTAARLCTLSKTDRTELQTLVNTFERARDDLEHFITALQADWEEAIEGKSDRWKESEAGSAAQERLDALTAWHDELPEVGPALPEMF